MFDLCKAAYTQRRALSDIRADAVMSRETVACSPSDPLGHAEKLVKDHQVRRLPVLDTS
jgi:CBS-domain-containing membrane protein